MGAATFEGGFGAVPLGLDIAELIFEGFFQIGAPPGAGRAGALPETG